MDGQVLAQKPAFFTLTTPSKKGPISRKTPQKIPSPAPRFWPIFGQKNR
jgi:hypothetical protein